MNSSSSSSQFRISESVREIVNEDGAVLLDMKQGLCFSINPSGTRIWELVKKGCSVDEIEDALQAEFDVSRAQIKQDIREFVQKLIADKLISTVTKECAETANENRASMFGSDETARRQSTKQD